MYLYDLAEEAVALEGLCAMDEGEWTEEHEALAQELSAKLVQKADAFGGYLKTLEGRGETIKEEELRLKNRRLAIENHVARLKAYAMIALEHMGKEKVEGALFTLRVQQNPPSVQVADGVALGDEYVRVVPESRVPDKTKLLQALKAGVTVEGVTLTRTSSLRIR